MPLIPNSADILLAVIEAPPATPCPMAAR